MKNKLHKIITIVLFAAVLITCPVLTFIFMPQGDRPFSENENRYLTAFPKVSFDTYIDRKLTKGIESWFSDRFFGREDWIRIKNTIEMLSGKMEINGIYTANNQMMQHWEGFDKTNVDKSLSAIDAFASQHKDVPTYFMLAPTSQEIFAEKYLPSYAPVGNQTEFMKYCAENLKNCKSIDIMTPLKNHAGEYIYYRTDHHWTSLGAYYAYLEAGASLGYTPNNLSAYSIEHASDSFKGTLYSKTLDSRITPDVIDFYHTSSNQNIKMSVFTGEETNEYGSFYFRDFLDVKDKYAAFLGQNVPMIDIKTDNEGPALLIFKDSYAHALIPFLASHYSRVTVLDMRYINIGYSELVNVDNYDSVLVMYNAITFSEDTDIRKISKG